jgi:putative flippase GtrA
MKRDLKVFLIVGFLTVFLDFLAYKSLLLLLHNLVDVAKGLGYLTGTVFAYFANKHWTFRSVVSHQRSVWRFCVLYFISFSANIFCNDVGLSIFDGYIFSLEIAFLCATIISAALNFFGMKNFVFPRSNLNNSDK